MPHPGRWNLDAFLIVFVIVKFNFVPCLPFETILPKIILKFFATSFKLIIDLFLFLLEKCDIIFAIVIYTVVLIRSTVIEGFVPRCKSPKYKQKLIIINIRVPRIINPPSTVDVSRITILPGAFICIIDRSPCLVLLKLKSLLINLVLDIILATRAVY